MAVRRELEVGYMIAGCLINKEIDDRPRGLDRAHAPADFFKARRERA